MVKALKDSGGPTTAKELGIDVDFYREAVIHAREIRKRYSALDVAADAGYLRGIRPERGLIGPSSFRLNLYGRPIQAEWTMPKSPSNSPRRPVSCIQQ